MPLSINRPGAHEDETESVVHNDLGMPALDAAQHEHGHGEQAPVAPDDHGHPSPPGTPPAPDFEGAEKA